MPQIFPPFTNPRTQRSRRDARYVHVEVIINSVGPTVECYRIIHRLFKERSSAWFSRSNILVFGAFVWSNQCWSLYPCKLYHPCNHLSLLLRVRLFEGATFLGKNGRYQVYNPRAWKFKESADVQSGRSISHGFSPSSPRRRLITTLILLFFVSTVIPYQFAFIDAVLVQLLTCIRALRLLKLVSSSTCLITVID